MSEKSNKLPKYLYHYTSLSTLALILESKTIKFNALSELDDLIEVQTKDLEGIGKITFVSSWTSNPKESIPLWKMYSNNMSGVRIRLSSTPFKYKFQIFNNYYNIPGFFHHSSNMPVRIKYTNDTSLIIPRISTLGEDGIVYYDFSKLAQTKNKAWKFQIEWRFIAYFIKSIHYKINEVSNIKKHFDEIDNYTNISFPYKCLFADLDQTVFEKMVILCGPHMNEGDKVILKSLIKEFNPSAKVQYSKLQIRNN